MALHCNTPIIMFSGEPKNISELKVGDLLMGSDSTPRKVLTLNHSPSPAFEIRPIRGLPFFVDECHPLILQKSIYLVNQKNETRVGRHYPKYRHLPNQLPVTVKNVLSKNSCALFKCYFLHKVMIRFPYSPTLIDPYFLGVWLGDGTRHLVSITTQDKEIRDEVYRQAFIWGLKVSINAKKNNKAATYIIVKGNVKGFGRNKNGLFNQFKNLNLINNKHVPAVYLHNSEQVRLQLLAGFIDTDGSISNNVYDAFQKDHRLAKEICRLANSLGFRSFIAKRIKKIKSIGFEGDYYHIIISGDIDRIPVRLDRKKVGYISQRHDRKSSGFRIHATHQNLEMVSITTDKDNIFLLEDGTFLSGERSVVPDFNSYSKDVVEKHWNKIMDDFICFVKSNNRYPTGRQTKIEGKLVEWMYYNICKMRLGKYSVERLRRYECLKKLLESRRIPNPLL